MSSLQKAALSFLSALVLFAGFVFFAQTSLMAQIETKFYAQAKIAEKDTQLEKLSERCNSNISSILAKIQTEDQAYLKSSAVKTFVHQNPSEKDATERKNLTARLFDELEDYGLDGIRIIEKNGRTLHYSSYDSDVLKRVSLNTTYKLYNDVIKDSDELLAEDLLVDADKPENKLLLDKARNRLIISFPFYITDNTYFATLVCYFDIGKFEQALLDDRTISLAEGLSIITDENSYNGGFVLGLPKNGQSEFNSPVLASWKNNRKNQELGLERILQKDDGSYWLLMTSPLSEYFKVSAVYSSTLFELPRELKLLIYICVFMTLLLVCSLLFNLKRDYLTVIKTRIKKVQFGIINEYLENKEKVEWAQVARQLENRKAELSEEIKKSIGGKSQKYSKQVDAYLDSSWADIICLLKEQTASETNLGGATIEEIRRVIEDVLKNSQLNVRVAASAATPVQVAEPVEEIEEVEEAEEAEALEEVEEIEEVEEVEEAEALEEVEEIEEVEEVEEAEPLEEVEEIEEVEEAEEAEPLEEVEEAEAVEEVEEAEAVEEVEEVEEAEEVEEVEKVEEVEELEEIEELDDAEELLEEAPVSAAGIPMKLPPLIDNDDPRFHEELSVMRIIEDKTQQTSSDYPFVAEIPHFILGNLAEPEIEEIADAEELPDAPYFAMTQFGQNEQPVIELRGEGDTIIEQDGVYSIADNLSYTKVFLNQEFKMLVDSVLQK